MNGRVLIVDDEEAIVDGLICLLEIEQIESSGASDRISADSLMDETFFSVIVADLRLRTVAEGLNLLDDIRRISPRSRVVTLTGFSTPELEEEVLRRGAVMVIRKPAGSEEIIAAISKLLGEVERLASEETLDFENLHSALRRLLHSIPRQRYGLTPQETEEIVQQAWLLFLENREVIQKVRPWLTGTVANLCLQQLGRTRRRRETFPGDEVLAAVPATQIEGDSNIALGQIMAVLDKQSRTLCRLIAIEGYGYDEVSEIMKLPIGSIGPMYLRAKSKMRAQMAA